ncbi:MAG: S9 family peptidase [Pacificimonas sp.]
MKTFLLAAACALVALPATARPLTSDDLASLNRLGDVALSPDEATLVFSMRELDAEADKGRTDLFSLDYKTPNAAPVRLHAHPESDGSPTFSPDGSRLYWLSGRSGASQIWMAPTAGGEPVQVTDIEDGISGFHLAQSGDRVAYWRDVMPEAETDGDGRVYDRLFARHWDTWDEGGKSELFAQGLTSEGLLEGSPVAVSAALDGNVPGKPFGGGSDIAFAADGKTLYFALRERGGTEAWSTDLDIYSVPVDGSAAPTVLTGENEATDTMPAVSPDGRYLAYAAMTRPGYESDRLVLMLRDLATGETRPLTSDLDSSVQSIMWAPDSASVFVTAYDGWNRRLHRVALDGTRTTEPVGDGSVSLIAATDDGLLYSRASLTEPGDLYWLGGDGTMRLTGINAEKLDGIDLATVERFSFAGAGDNEVFGYVVKPAGLAEGETAPTVLWSHGGPQGLWSNSWSSRWNPLVWAGAGYAIVTVDFHGSAGYGQEFKDSINNDWGGKPLEDLQKGLAYARETWDWIDDERACAAGGSYGGYMMNWIEGAWPDGLTCLVNHAGLFDMRSFYYSTEELWFPEWDFGGPYWAREEAYEKWNPATKVEDWKTPMLVIHGLKDYRVPYTQGLMAYTALQRRGIDSRMLIFDDENHWILTASNSRQWHSEVFRWLDEYLGEEAR